MSSGHNGPMTVLRSTEYRLDTTSLARDGYIETQLEEGQESRDGICPAPYLILYKNKDDNHQRKKEGLLLLLLLPTEYPVVSFLRTEYEIYTIWLLPSITAAENMVAQRRRHFI